MQKDHSQSHINTVSNPNALITFNNVSLGYHDRTVLLGMNISIAKGEYIGIAGPNGSGKTTLFRALLGLIPPQKGEILINGKPIDKTFLQKVGYCPQNIKIEKEFPLTVYEAVMMGRYGHIGIGKKPHKEDHEAVNFALHQVHMETYKDRPIGHLSGGEQQKVIIARALAVKPEILLLDEPTSALDFQMTSSVFELVHELNTKYHYLIIMVHHNVNLLRRNCHRLIVVGDQAIRYDGKPTDEKADDIIKIAYHLND